MTKIFSDVFTFNFVSKFAPAFGHSKKRHHNKKAPQPDVTICTLVDLVDITEKTKGVQLLSDFLKSESL